MPPSQGTDEICPDYRPDAVMDGTDLRKMGDAWLSPAPVRLISRSPLLGPWISLPTGRRKSLKGRDPRDAFHVHTAPNSSCPKPLSAATASVTSPSPHRHAGCDQGQHYHTAPAWSGPPERAWRARPAKSTDPDSQPTTDHARRIRSWPRRMAQLARGGEVAPPCHGQGH